MKAWDIVGYTYQADTYCPGDMLDIANAWLARDGVRVPYLVLRDALEAWATSARVDRYDESTYDSGDFPKVIFASQVEDDSEVCGACLDSLVSVSS